MNAGDTLFCYVYLDPANPPGEVLLQWQATDYTGWSHRAYWGADAITDSWANPRTYLGPLPRTGGWVRLEVPASTVGLEGKTVTGLAFSLYDGTAAWDSAGNCPAGNDSDGDLLPDWWELDHFGDLSQAGTDDYDQDDSNNLAEFQAGTDPNTVEFTFALGSWYAKPGSFSAPLQVSKGVPSQMAVLMDSLEVSRTDIWGPYNPSPTISLPTEGQHRVLIGLKGRSTHSLPTWQGAVVTIDGTPPGLTITSPGSDPLTRLRIDVCGTASEYLQTLTYDLQNSAGTVTGQPGHISDVTAQGYQFKCNDVLLAEGANQLTLRATDRAGNRTTVTRTLVVNLSLDHTAPAPPTVTWPTDGTPISTPTFIIEGTVNDPTASIKAVVVADGVTAENEGIVLEDGRFWIDAVPVVGDNNTVSVTATDDAGNLSTTTLQVLRSLVALTVDEIPESALTGSTITLSGTVSVPNVSITVNGTSATISGTAAPYGWVANNVPVPPGDRKDFDVQARAAAPPNPVSGSARSSAEADIPPDLALKEVHSVLTTDLQGFREGPVSGSSREQVDFVAGVGGHYHSNLYSEVTGANGLVTTESVEKDGPIDANGNATLKVWNAGLPGPDDYYPVALDRWENAARAQVENHPGSPVFATERHAYTASTTLRLRTNGRPSDGHRLRPVVLTTHPSRVAWWVNDANQWLRTGVPIGACPNVSLLGQPVDANSHRYERLAANETHIITLEHTEYCPASYDWLDFSGSTATRPPKAVLSFAYHPKFRQLGLPPTIKEVQAKFDEGACMLAEDNDPFPAGWVADYDPRVTLGDPRFDNGLYLSDDEPFYVEFEIRRGPLLRDAHYSGGVDAFFNTGVADRDNIVRDLQAEEYFEPPLAYLDNRVAYYLEADIKIVNAVVVGGQKYFQWGCTPIGARSMICLTRSLPAVGWIHEWGHTASIWHRGVANEVGDVDNPGPLTGGVMCDGLPNTGPKVNRNEYRKLGAYGGMQAQ